MSRLLGMTDKKDYLDSDDLIERKSARGIIIENNKIYLSHARINDTYKIPGGGNDLNESILDTLYREVLEEVGINVDINNVKEYGIYIDTWKSVKDSEKNKRWYQTSYYFICDRVGEVMPISPTESEIRDLCEGVLVDIDEAISANLRYINSLDKEHLFLLRETNVLKLIKEELIK